MIVRVQNTAQASIVLTSSKIFPKIRPGENELEIGEKTIKRKDGVIVWSLSDLKKLVNQPQTADRIKKGTLRFDDLGFLRDHLGYSGEIPTATSEQIKTAFSRAKAEARAELELEYEARLKDATEAIQKAAREEYEAKQAEADKRHADTLADLRGIIASLKDVMAAPAPTAKGKTKPKDEEPTPTPKPESPAPGLEGAEKALEGTAAGIGEALA